MTIEHMQQFVAGNLPRARHDEFLFSLGSERQHSRIIMQDTQRSQRSQRFGRPLSRTGPTMLDLASKMTDLVLNWNI